MVPVPALSRTARLTAALVARHELATVLRLLNGAGILPMPLRAALLQHVVYSDPADRRLPFADVLIPPGRFDEALGAMQAAGHEITSRGVTGATTRAPGAALQVALHARPFAAGLYDLDGAGMFARGRIDEQLFDGVVVSPDPQDVFAHLVGSFARARHGASAREQLRDFSAVASRFGLAERPLARHLERHGLARAARYTLAHADDAYSLKVLRALAPDAVGRASAAVARRLTSRYGSEAPITKIAPHLVNRSLPRGLLSVGAHVALNVKSRVTKRFEDR